MPGSPVWSIKHHINLFQRFTILPENDPKCWLLEISSCTFLPMRITASFPIMFWRKGFVLLLSLQAKIHPSDWQDLQRDTSFHLFLRIDGPFPSSMKQCVSVLFYNFSRKFPWYPLKEPFQCLTTFTIGRFFLLFSLSPFLLIWLLRVWEGPIIIQSSITVSEMVGSPLHQKTCWFSSTVLYWISVWCWANHLTSLCLNFPPAQLVSLSHGFLLC